MASCIRRIGLIHKLSLDSRKLIWSAQVNVLLNNCKQNITQLSLLVGTTVHIDRVENIIECLKQEREL